MTRVPDPPTPKMTIGGWSGKSFLRFGCTVLILNLPLRGRNPFKPSGAGQYRNRRNRCQDISYYGNYRYELEGGVESMMIPPVMTRAHLPSMRCVSLGGTRIPMRVEEVKTTLGPYGYPCPEPRRELEPWDAVINDTGWAAPNLSHPIRPVPLHEPHFQFGTRAV